MFTLATMGRRAAPATPSTPARLATLAAAALVVLTGATTLHGTALAQAQPAASAPAGPQLRPEVAKPLFAAQEAMKNKPGAEGAKEALARVLEAEAVPGLTPQEQYTAHRLKAVAAFTSGDRALSLTTFETVLASPLLPAADRLPITEVSAKIALELNDLPRATKLLKAYRELGGNEPSLRRRLTTLLIEQNDHAGALKEAQSLVAADEAAGQTPPEVLLKVMAISQNKLGDGAGYYGTLEKLTRYYTTLDYWSELIARTARKPGFADDRLRLDVYRLQRAVGLSLEADEQADMAQRAQLTGLPAEAQKLMEEGYATGLFGKAGSQAAAYQKLREQATKAAAADQKGLADSENAARNAKDGNALVNLGVAVAGTGATERGLALVEAGVAKGGLRRADEALLRQGMLQARLGRNDDALKTFAQVQGADGTADLARLWSLHLRTLPSKKG